MTAFIEPCLAKLVGTAPEGPQWVHEIKFDGYRLQAHVEKGKVRLYTRSGLDWTARFPTIVKGLEALAIGSAVLDGEAVVETADGVSSFAGLVATLKGEAAEPIIFYAFDLLRLDGADVSKLPLAKRKALLKPLLGKRRTGAIRYSDHVEGNGQTMQEKACALGVEGIVSKRIDLAYRGGRRGDWLKIKCANTDELVVGGYLDSTAMTEAVGALSLGYFEGGRLVYAGRVGTGFSHKTAHELWKRFQPLRLAKSPFASPLDRLQARLVQWVRPEIVVQVDYLDWTGDGLLRHAAFKAVREDKPAKAVANPRAMAD